MVSQDRLSIIKALHYKHFEWTSNVVVFHCGWSLIREVSQGRFYSTGINLLHLDEMVKARSMRKNKIVFMKVASCMLVSQCHVLDNCIENTVHCLTSDTVQ